MSDSTIDSVLKFINENDVAPDRGEKTPSENMIQKTQDEKHRILIVDDEEENLDLLASTLHRGNIILKAGSAEEAMGVLRNEEVHMIISDQKMPGLSGTELLEICKAQYEHIIRILITGYADMKVAVDAINKGEVHRYISKPFDPSELRIIVATELRRFDLQERNKKLTQELIVKNQELEQMNVELKQQKAEIERLAMEYKEQKELAEKMSEKLAESNTELIGAQKEIKRKNVKLETVNKKLERLSITDGLTGFYNMRYMHQLLDSEMGRAKRYDLHLSLLMVDLDYFKEINDTYGHPFGDKVLKQVTEKIRRNIRETDWPTRYGGDEFVVILPHTGKDRAVYMAKRIHADIRATKLLADDGSTVQPSVSIGIAYYPHEKVASKKGIIEIVDKALYKAKQLGRNRIEIAD